MDAEAMEEITRQLREVTDWYQTAFGAPAGDFPVPEVGNPNGLDQADLLLLEEMLGESYHDRSVESDVLAQGGGTEDDRKILSPQMQEGARNETRGLSTRPCLSKV